MQMAVYDEADQLFAQLVVTAARRRGHAAREIINLDDIKTVFISPPGAIIMGFGRVDNDTIGRITHAVQVHPDSLIFLTVEDASPIATLAALEAGATDILHKPILPREVVIRAERAQPVWAATQPEGVIHVADLEVDMDQVRAVKAGHDLALTRMELRLLYCLMQHYGRVTPIDRLAAFGWGSDEVALSSLKTHISHLRQKLTDAGGVPMRITARQMLGYMLSKIDDAQTADA